MTSAPMSKAVRPIEKWTLEAVRAEALSTQLGLNFSKAVRC